MNKKLISILYSMERHAHIKMVQLRQRLWYESDIYSMKQKMIQCELIALSKTQEREIKTYWKSISGYDIPVYWHQYFYSRNGIFSKQYVPTCLYHSRIIYRLNCRQLTKAYTDKCAYDEFFRDVWRPKTIVRNINGCFYDDRKAIKREEAVAICSDLDDAVIKPSMDGMWGMGVRAFSSEKGRVTEYETVDGLFDKMGMNYIVQKKVRQHHEMSRLNPTSLNTLRVLSFRHGDEVAVLYAVVRIGRKNQIVDNETAGGINADIDLNSGRIIDCAYGLPSEKRIEYTDVGTRLKGFLIPSFDEVISMVKDLHLRLPYFHLVGWDLGIDEEGKPVMIEWNRTPDLSQTAHGPAFGDRTEEIVRFAMSQPDTFDARLWNG